MCCASSPSMADSVPALVLAGGHRPEEVARELGIPHKALAPVAGKPVVRWVVEALDAAASVGPTVVVTALPEIARVLPSEVRVAQPTGGEIMDTLQAGMACLPQADWFLACTSDMPLLTPAAVDDFVRRSLDSGAELCYSVVRGDRLAKGTTGEKRTLIALREGAFSGGNLFLMSRRFLEQEGPRVSAAFAARKHPLHLASLLGWGFIWGMLWARLGIPWLSLRQVIAKAERVLQVRVAVVDSEYPEVCFDIDAVVHLAAAERALQAPR